MSAQLGFFAAPPPARPAPLLDHVRTHARNVPGIYRMRDSGGAVLYVGRSRQLRTRLLSYFRGTRIDEKPVRLLQATARIEWEELPSEFEAVVRECRLIRDHLPPFNRDMARPTARYWVVWATSHVAPRLRVTRVGQLPAAARGPLVGPFTHPRVVRDAIRVLNDALGLRDCADEGAFGYTDDGADLFATPGAPPGGTPRCHRFETRRCLGPCVAAGPRATYAARVAAALSYLAGEDAAPAAALHEAMAAASAALAFERAGWLRDRLAALSALEEQLARIRARLDLPSGFYSVAGAPGGDRLYALADGAVVGGAAVGDADAVAALDQRWRQARTLRRAGLAPDTLEEVVTVARWFATRPDEAARLAPTTAGAIAALRGRPLARAEQTAGDGRGARPG
jgi:excinuclease ABC subunit C